MRPEGWGGAAPKEPCEWALLRSLDFVLLKAAGNL
jgi:hypothetical protein